MRWAKPGQSRNAHKIGSPIRRPPTCRPAFVYVLMFRSACRSLLPIPRRCILRQHISMAYEIDVAHRLQADDALQRTMFVIAPEGHASRNLPIEFITRHVGLVPLVGGDDTAIGVSRTLMIAMMAARSSVLAGTNEASVGFLPHSCSHR